MGCCGSGADPGARGEALLAAATRGEDFSLSGRRLRAKVVAVADRGRLRLALEPFAGAGLVQVRARLAGCVLARGAPARDSLARWTLGRVLDVACGRFDRRGRLLVNLSADGLDVGRWLVANSLAAPWAAGEPPPPKALRFRHSSL